MRSKIIRIISFNILFGAYSPDGRLEAIAALLREHRPDVVLLQECMDWDKTRLDKFAALVGLPHAVLGSSNRRGSGRCYHVAALSRSPIDSSISHGRDALSHGCLEVRIGDVSVVNMHLNAHSESNRLHEMEHLLEHSFPPHRIRNENLVLGGDLNALSRLDPYPSDLGSTLKTAGVTKYGNPLAFEVMDLLSQANLSDPFLGKTPWATRYRPETEPATPTRTDYLLVSPKLQSKVIQTQVLPLEKEESDHAPILLELQSG